MLWVVPPSGETMLREPQGNSYRTIAEDIADVLLPWLGESKNIGVGMALDRCQFVVWSHGPELDLVLGEEVEQILPTTEDFTRRAARWMPFVDRPARAAPKGEVEEI